MYSYHNVHTYVRMGYEYNANMTRLGAIQLNLNYDTYMNIVYTVEVSVTGKSGISTSFFTVYLGYLWFPVLFYDVARLAKVKSFKSLNLTKTSSSMFATAEFLYEERVESTWSLTRAGPWLQGRGTASIRGPQRAKDRGESESDHSAAQRWQKWNDLWQKIKQNWSASNTKGI